VAIIGRFWVATEGLRYATPQLRFSASTVQSLSVSKLHKRLSCASTLRMAWELHGARIAGLDNANPVNRSFGSGSVCFPQGLQGRQASERVIDCIQNAKCAENPKEEQHELVVRLPLRRQSSRHWLGQI